ncbi:uncharacterized protein LOC118926793 isoform X3 [Manis pentadactyla]|uniref:uncharacterized protein LOC118926793 isoform X3 n=1 Tax=Manis pentadactyla TaxID=143292 RepID=UPI00255CD145|nr:uncharacterized protein LOC118926793 isoform X3 [Manis pentadactyla]
MYWGVDGRPTQNPAIIEEGFPLTRPDWDFNTPEGSQAQMNTAQSKTCEKLTSSRNERRLPERDGETSVRIRNSRISGISQESTNLQMTDAEATWFTDGSSYLDQGMCKAGAAVVDGEKIVWAQALPEGTSVQKAELIALTRALELGSGKKINIYTDSRYAFATAHVHGAIYQQRGLLTSEGREIKNKPEITALLEALHKPAKVESSPGSPKRSVDPTKSSLRAWHSRSSPPVPSWRLCVCKAAPSTDPGATVERTLLSVADYPNSSQSRRDCRLDSRISCETCCPSRDS